MALDKKLFIISSIITILLFISIYSLNIMLNGQREDFLTEKMDEVVDQYDELQALSLMADVFGDEAACLSLQTKIKEMDKNLWDLGLKIDKYRSLTEEYMQDPFYLSQKKKFNRREVIYYTLLEDLNNKCNFSQNIILFFYKKAEICTDCDAMSFVLTDIKRSYDNEVAIFSFDSDMELPSIDVLTKLYNITEYPCIVVNEETMCGLKNKKTVIEKICEQDTQQFSGCQDV